MFQTEPGVWFSGEDLAGKLSVSRAAVWKAVRSLRDEGYRIDAVPNRGYRLSDDIDILSERGIWKYLDPCLNMLDLHLIPEIGSTNAALLEKANTGSPEGTVLIAGMQTNGKGRLGRRFYSPADTGIYLSVLLRPESFSPEQAVRLTTIAAVAACEAVEESSGKTAGIKWVNDICLDGKKVCGILTEGTVSMETGLMDSVVLGIGINAYPPENGFPKELQTIAGAVFDEQRCDGRNSLAAGFLNHFMARYMDRDLSKYVPEYRRRSLAIGRNITILSPDGKRHAYAEDVDEACRLVVRNEDGSTEHLAAGEISIRL